MEWSRDTPWRQGHILSIETCQALGLSHATHSDDMLVMVISHDCDLACESNVEPTVEVIVGRRLSAPEGNATHAKSVRTLHLEMERQGQVWIELLSVQRSFLQKSALADALPNADYFLSPRNLAILQQWLAIRYRRSAFPNEFERRLRGVRLHEKIAEATKAHQDNIVGVFFDLDQGKQIERSGQDDAYALGIFVMYYGAGPDPDGASTAAEKVAAAIEKSFKAKLFDEDKGWKDIELLWVDPIADTAIRYADAMLLKRWLLDYMSLRAEPQQSLPDK